MTEKVLISTDNNALSTFKKDVQAVCDRSNELITLFGLFQSYESITAEEQFQKLLADPGSYFDEVLLRHVKLDTGGRKPDPAVLAQLVGLHRDEYLNAVAGLPLTSEDCEPCRKIARQIPGRKAISKYQFDQYRDYLLFSAGIFTVNTEAVNNSLDRFSTYAETPAEIERYALFNDLVQMLNRWDAVYPLSGSDKLEVKKIFGLHLSRGGEGDFMINPITLTKAVQSIKYQ